VSTSIGAKAAGWWQGLQPAYTPGGRPGDRGALARLRRCATLLEAASEPATIALCRRLEGRERDLDRAALIAAVLAHVRKDNPSMTVARQIGRQQDNSAAMSDLRFRRLLGAETDDERLTAFRRLVAIAGRTLNVSDLAASLWHWGDERRRLAWIYAYYDAPDVQAQAAAPHATEDAPA
jgi:CRISPR system Cascade subunit CasB